MKKKIVVLAIIVIGLIGYYQFWFLRLPDRQIPTIEDAFVSPANGVISAVIQWDSSVIEIPKHGRILNMLTEDVGKSGWMISIEMDITNVHYQRCPIPSTHISSKYVAGSFKNALIKENDFGIRLENEHNTMLFETSDQLRYKVVQVAGLVARKIVDYTESDKKYERGEVIGLIRLGSQVALILPSTIKPLVKEGDNVVDGESILATMQ